ncbi:GNAT family N-acetyltransferase [Planctobacterium marinum]|uniref:tRNA(Met) cytidine acetyltransferase TmcA n=1 Tax=Planctobacterium marinum TaxID=1631968 RepID=A0AA48HWP3_9ALTE|nr:tRNA(Met) cytidine acetyltransferase TmcA [Planctobacterium marinum]
MDAQLQSFIQERIAALHHRQLLVISGTEVWGINQVEQLINAIPSPLMQTFTLLTCNTPVKEGINQSVTNNSQYRYHLGREYDWVIYNAWQGLRANALAALAGTVKKNGLMILLCPELSSWPTYNDPYQANRISFGEIDNLKSSNFIAQLVSQIQQDPLVLLLNDRGFTGKNYAVETGQHSAHLTEQRAVIEQIKKVATGHRKRPLVITADRGRGKTAALGIASGELSKEGQKRILVTAPQKASVETLFQHAQSISPSAHEHVQFVALDELIINQPAADLLLVDEAAAIPVYQLQTLTERYHRIVFSSTIHGYEGSGRGFEVRFKPWLTKYRPEGSFSSLSLPFRWYENDALEQFWWRALHLRKTAGATPEVLQKNSINIEALSGEQLIADPDLLNAVFSLLVDAHYQTSPDDLMALLDAPEQRLFVLFNGHHTANNLIAAVCGNIEGGFDDEELMQAIVAGQRRVQGHMLAQQIAYGNANTQYLSKLFFRVIRIAVAESHRSHGLGKRLIEFVARWCRANDIDYLGSSFGATAKLLKFWQQSGCEPVLLGFHRDKATAEYNLTVLRAITEQVSDAMPEIQQNFARLLRFHLSGLYQNLDITLYSRLAQSNDLSQHLALTEEYAKNSLHLFCCGNRSLELSAPVLEILALRYIVKSDQPKELPELLIDWLLKRYSQKALITRHKLVGKKQLNSQLRDCAKMLLRE